MPVLVMIRKAKCGIFPKYLEVSRKARIPHSKAWYSFQLRSRQVSQQYWTYKIKKKKDVTNDFNYLLLHGYSTIYNIKDMSCHFFSLKNDSFTPLARWVINTTNFSFYYKVCLICLYKV